MFKTPHTRCPAQEWDFACNKISVGCSAYSDEDWVKVVRRWPPKIADRLGQFLKREIPEAIKGQPGSALAPVAVT